MQPDAKEIEKKLKLLKLYEAREAKYARMKLSLFYPERGPLRRELYIPHMKFFAAGAHCNIRAILAANRIGKTEGIGGCETAYHVTGDYPDWWTGKTFPGPIKAWACGKTNLKAKDIVQKKLLGPVGALGTGLIPGDKIIEKSIKMKPGVPDAVETVLIKNYWGGESVLSFKSYAEGRSGFEGEELDWIWLDEEPPLDVYGECVTRTMSTIPDEPPGHLICTFTPLEGMSEVVLAFIPNGKLPESGDGLVVGNKFIIMATWDDAPHLSDDDKKMMFDELPIYQRDARSKGIPQLGSGAIYPISEQEITCDDFEIPEWWPRLYGFDVGWNWTAAAWIAHNPDDDVAYVYSIYKRGKAEPVVHGAAINARGEWIPGAIDPASAGSNPRDGLKIVDDYNDLGLNLHYADNTVTGEEGGIHRIWMRLSVGKLKIFKSCVGWFEEFRLYRRDEKGRIVKTNDHLMDATRYGTMSLHLAELPPPDPEMIDYDVNTQQTTGTTYGWN